MVELTDEVIKALCGLSRTLGALENQKDLEIRKGLLDTYQKFSKPILDTNEELIKQRPELYQMLQSMKTKLYFEILEIQR